MAWIDYDPLGRCCVTAAITWISAKALSFLSSSVLMVEVSGLSLAAILIAELVFMGYASSSIAAMKDGNPSARRDMLSYFLDVTGLLRILGHAATLGVGYAIGLGIKSAFDLNLTGLLKGPILQITAFIFCKSFLNTGCIDGCTNFPSYGKFTNIITQLKK